MAQFLHHFNECIPINLKSWSIFVFFNSKGLKTIRNRWEERLWLCFRCQVGRCRWRIWGPSKCRNKRHGRFFWEIFRCTFPLLLQEGLCLPSSSRSWKVLVVTLMLFFHWHFYTSQVNILYTLFFVWLLKISCHLHTDYFLTSNTSDPNGKIQMYHHYIEAVKFANGQKKIIRDPNFNDQKVNIKKWW